MYLSRGPDAAPDPAPARAPAPAPTVAPAPAPACAPTSAMAVQCGVGVLGTHTRNRTVVDTREPHSTRQHAVLQYLDPRRSTTRETVCQLTRGCAMWVVGRGVVWFVARCSMSVRTSARPQEHKTSHMMAPTHENKVKVGTFFSPYAAMIRYNYSTHFVPPAAIRAPAAQNPFSAPRVRAGAVSTFEQPPHVLPTTRLQHLLVSASAPRAVCGRKTPPRRVCAEKPRTPHCCRPHAAPTPPLTYTPLPTPGRCP